MFSRQRLARGFTLIEMLIVVVIVGILAAVALPSYFQYVQRSKIIEATTGLSNLRTKMEQYFLDNRKYTGGCALLKGSIQNQVQSFTIDCPTETDTAYLLTADGKAANGMTSFHYQVDQKEVKSSTGPAGWSAGVDCWATRKDGTCG